MPKYKKFLNIRLAKDVKFNNPKKMFAYYIKQWELEQTDFLPSSIKIFDYKIFDQNYIWRLSTVAENITLLSTYLAVWRIGKLNTK